MRFPIKKIYIDESVQDSEIAKKIIEKNPAPINILKTKELENCSITEGKQTMLITFHKGDLVKQCPGTGDPYLCCRYFVINQQTQCPMDCTYCILQNYLDTSSLTIYADLDSIWRETDSLIKKQPERFIRFGTGELTDSLALDHLTEVSIDFLRYFSQKRNTIIEFKTKTDNIENLLNYPIKNAVISWSVNPQALTVKYESGSVSLKRRLVAAQKCQEKDFKLGFHFDPLLYVADWEKLYKEVIDRIFYYIDPERVAWISLGSLRYPPELKTVMKKRFSGHTIIYEEMITGLDGKMRYPRPLRIEMFKKIFDYLKSKDDDLFIYFCMEPGNVWDRVMHKRPHSNAELDYWFAKSLYSRFPEIKMDPPEKKVYLQYPDARLTYKE